MPGKSKPICSIHPQPSLHRRLKMLMPPSSLNQPAVAQILYATKSNWFQPISHSPSRSKKETANKRNTCYRKREKKVAKNQLKKLFIFPSPSGKNSHAHDPPSLEAICPQAAQVQAVLTPLGPYLGVAWVTKKWEKLRTKSGRATSPSTAPRIPIGRCATHCQRNCVSKWAAYIYTREINIYIAVYPGRNISQLRLLAIVANKMQKMPNKKLHLDTNRNRSGRKKEVQRKLQLNGSQLLLSWPYRLEHSLVIEKYISTSTDIFSYTENLILRGCEIIYFYNATFINNHEYRFISIISQDFY